MWPYSLTGSEPETSASGAATAASARVSAPISPTPGVTEVTHTISLSDLGDPLPLDVLCIAAHAVVALVDKQSAWGYGYEFEDDRNWSMYFTYEVQ